VPEADGRYVQPINYEQHCSSCHPLRLADDLAALGKLPHEAPEIVRGVIRERVTNLLAEPIAAEPPPVIRRLPRPAILSDPQSNSADALLAAANNAVFGLQAKGLCRKCHHVELRDGQWHVPMLNPAFGMEEQNSTREMIPSRWFFHGQFHHEKHLTVACADCHAAAESSLTSDLLLPGIANCRKCHGTNPTISAVGVAADCILCHDYHGPTKSLPQSIEAMSLNKFLMSREF
jgi:ribosomal protein L40E